ncbi:MAG TPA: polysaccharide deacetylase family protein [Tepidisphaeraceae bacterium]|nr:polysaccharide deacetylase family protein [Tepidisphaeraceae bacterium]
MTRTPLGTGAIVLLYHRVTVLPTDPQLLSVSPAHFAEHLDVLRRVAMPVAMAELARRVRERTVGDGMVAVTFDDGYADNLHEAEPLLRLAGIPATVFATTGHTGTSPEFFWDDLDRILLQPGTLPTELRVTAGHREHAWALGNTATYTATDAARHAAWDVTMDDAPTPRQQAYHELCGVVHRLPSAERADVMRQVRSAAGATDNGRPSHRMMTGDELRQLAAGGVVEVAAHTVTHPLLSAETPDRQRHELATSKQSLEQILGPRVAGFSYPFGGRRDYTPDTVAAVRKAGFAYACSNFLGRVTAATDVYQIPRFIVRDWPGDEFERRLREWFAR